MQDLFSLALACRESPLCSAVDRVAQVTPESALSWLKWLSQSRAAALTSGLHEKVKSAVKAKFTEASFWEGLSADKMLALEKVVKPLEPSDDSGDEYDDLGDVSSDEEGDSGDDNDDSSDEDVFGRKYASMKTIIEAGDLDSDDCAELEDDDMDEDEQSFEEPAEKRFVEKKPRGPHLKWRGRCEVCTAIKKGGCGTASAHWRCLKKPRVTQTNALSSSKCAKRPVTVPKTEASQKKARVEAATPKTLAATTTAKKTPGKDEKPTPTKVPKV